ncbi:MAG: hypothetical protein A2Z57_12085 [Planctomycetes bacterium RIFCSPHIGHO2_12_39_6]|nr:MAG: hypothetical protein A2Z57_12085 [Planctomycetes bacterium RIFCSPHIGHO2_12_39_6]
MKDFCFVNVSFREPYVSTQNRLRKSILSIYSDVTLFFWTDEMPPNAKLFHESLYGFKVHAIEYARQKGFNKVIWIDTCCVLKKEIERLFEALPHYGVYAIKDDQCEVYRYCSKAIKENFSIPNDLFLVGGSLYIFDFGIKLSEKIFNKWKEMEQTGFFGTQEMITNEKNNGIDICGHRMDETCLSIAIDQNGVRPLLRHLWMYDQVIEKKHFLKEGEKWYNDEN